MGTRRKLSVPMPEALLSPLVLPTQIQVVDVEFVLPSLPEPSPSDEEIRESVRKASERTMDKALDSLRMDGVTEQQLADLLSAARLDCLLRILDLNLDEVALRFVETGGATLGVSATIATELLPQIGDFL